MLEICYDIQMPQLTLNSSAQRILDQSWVKWTGLPIDTLMEQAAMAVTDACLEIVRQAKRTCLADRPRVLVLGGRGNNGGDAWACARQLHAAGFDVICCEALPGREPDVTAARQFDALRALELPWLERGALEQMPAPDLVVDGMLGTGYRAERGLPEGLTELCSCLIGWQMQGTKVVSIDLPSGVDADSGAVSVAAVRADCTVTFAACKTGLAAAPGCLYAGRVIVKAISMPTQWIRQTLDGIKLPELITGSIIAPWRPLRPADAYKSMFGHVLLVGGRPGTAGAISLAAVSAARTGAGLIHLAVSEQVYAAVLTALPSALIHAMPEDQSALDTLQTMSQERQAIAVGPGLGFPEWLPDYLVWLLQQKTPLVLDADALNQISRDPDPYIRLLRERAQSGIDLPVMTPHPGEFRRLAPDLAGLLTVNRQTAAIQLAERYTSIVVLKGAGTVVAQPDGSCAINTSGNAGMAKGGSGDCLTGIIAGLMALGLTPLQSAQAGVYLHGLAGDLAAASRGESAMLPMDMIEQIGQAWWDVGWADQPHDLPNDESQ